MKKTVLILLAFLILIFSSCRIGKTKVFKLADTYPADMPTTKADIEFARLVEEKSKGKIKIEVYRSAQLGEEKAAIEQVQLGHLEFSRVSLQNIASYYPKLNVLQMPYLYRNTEHMWKILEGPVGEQLLKEISIAKFTGLCYFDAASRNFYNRKKEIKSPADLRGLKIYVPENPFMQSIVRILGGVPKSVPTAELGSALQRGIIDGAENDISEFESLNHYQAAKFYSFDEHFKIPEILIVSLAVWNKLNKKEQDLIKLAAKEAAMFQKKLLKEKLKSIEDKVKGSGCTVTEIKDNSEFQNAMLPLYNSLPADQKNLVKIIRDVQ